MGDAENAMEKRGTFLQSSLVTARHPNMEDELAKEDNRDSTRSRKREVWQSTKYTKVGDI